MHDGYAYGNGGIVITMVILNLFFIFRFIPMRTATLRAAPAEEVHDGVWHLTPNAVRNGRPVLGVDRYGRRQ